MFSIARILKVAKTREEKHKKKKDIIDLWTFENAKFCVCKVIIIAINHIK
jgi:hypothetical protein